MSKSNSAKAKIKALIFDLRPGDVGRQLKAIKSLKVHGDETVVLPLLDVLTNCEDDEVKAMIVDTINTVKLTAVPAVIAKALMDEKYVSIRQILLSSIWNSGLDYRPYLSQIIQVAVDGEMLEALECITIIENAEGFHSEEQLYDALIILQEYLVNNQGVESPKNEILIEIAQLLQQQNDAI